MIPEFNDNGYLPPGIHPATLNEIAARFGHESELRRVQMESLRWMVELAWQAGVLRIVVNGSFVTEKWEPNDVDCVLLIDDDYPRDMVVNEELLEGLPFLTMEIVREDAFRQLTERTFANDRYHVPKGMIEVLP
jgi:hypothetical protein